MNSTTDSTRQEWPLEQKIQQPTSYSMHSLTQQPSVILDLIFSHLDLSDLEGAVFPVSRRLAAHLRRRSVAVHSCRTFDIGRLRVLRKFHHLASLWSLCSFNIYCFEYSSATPILKRIVQRLDIGKECPRLEKAILTIRTSDYLEGFVGSFSGCRFLRSLDYDGPPVRSLGRLKQLDRLSVHHYAPPLYHSIIDGPAFGLNELSQLKILALFDVQPGLFKILLKFPCLEELRLDGCDRLTIEQVLQLPKLKLLSIRRSNDHWFADLFRMDFPLLETMEISPSSGHQILPYIPTLKSVVLNFQEYGDDQPIHWGIAQEFLSLNPQISALEIAQGTEQADSVNDPSRLADFLEKHQAIENLQLPHYYIRSLMGGSSLFSQCFTDRFFFRTPAHRLLFIEGLRNLAVTRK